MHSRRTDPTTSHEAGDRHEATGKAASNRQACLEVVRNRDGLTAAEISAWAGLERHEASRRLPELRAMGLVVNGKARRCTVMCSRAMTWNLVVQEPK